MDEFYSMQTISPESHFRRRKREKRKSRRKREKTKGRHLKICVEKELNLFCAVPVRRTRSTEQKWKKERFIWYEKNCASPSLKEAACIIRFYLISGSLVLCKEYYKIILGRKWKWNVSVTPSKVLIICIWTLTNLCTISDFGILRWPLLK